MKGRQCLIACLALTLLAVVARGRGLERSFSYDELFTITNFTSSFGEAVGGQRAGNNHPFASLVATVARKLTSNRGSQERPLRLPFVAIGALAPGVLCWALWPLGRRRAWLAGGFLALAPPAVLASQQVRGYAPALLFGALALGAFVRCQRTGRARDMILLALAGGLGLWSHATLLLGLIALGSSTILFGPAPRMAARRGLAGAVLLALLLYANIFDDTAKFVLRNLRVGPAGGYNPGPLTLSSLAQAAGGPSLCLGLTALVALAAWKGPKPKSGASDPSPDRRAVHLALVLWSLSPLPLVFIGALGYGRFAWFAWPAWAALAASGASRVPQRHLGTILAGAWLAIAAWQLPAQARGEIHDLRGAVRVAHERSVQLEHATIIAYGPGAELLPYYGQVFAIDLRQAEDVSFFLSESAVIIVPLPASLDEPVPERSGARGTRTLRTLLADTPLADPIVLPGLESPVLVLSTRASPD